MNAQVELGYGELWDLAAVDPLFYCQHFFPKTFRQESPAFHKDFWEKIENPDYDYFAAEIFRGGAKTTLTRVAASRRIAYLFGRNLLSVAINETMAVETLRWIKKQVEQNTAWAQCYKVRQGSKWADDRIEIYHDIGQCTVNVLARGITGGIRGINLDDWRPDFVICDDICNDENTSTEEQRNKTNNSLFGVVVPGLAPKVEAPHRKVALLQTGLHKDDVINQAHRDPAWTTVKYPKLYVDEHGSAKSAWEEMYPIDAILKEKENYVKQRRLHIFLREFELKIVSASGAAFDTNWLKYWTVLPVGMRTYIGLDPASSSKKKAHKTAIVVVGVFRGQTYILDYMSQVGKNPDEIWEWLSAAVRNWHPRQVAVETVAYQKMLAWYLRTKMQEHNFYFPIREYEDRTSKPDRIRQAYTGIASNGQLYVHENHTQFVQDFGEYADDIDIDLLDAGAIAIKAANPWMFKGTDRLGADALDGEYEVEDERDIPALVYEGGAP